MNPVDLICVGTGDIAGYVALLSRVTPGVRIVAAVNPDWDSATRFARRHKIPHVYDSLEPALDAHPHASIYLAVPHDLHLPYLQQAIEANRSTFVEKPITRTLEEGIAVARASAATGIPVAVNYQYRYDNGIATMIRAIDRGSYGEPLFSRCLVAWSRDREYFTTSPWHRTVQRAGGGTLLTQGSHLIDVAIRALAGQEWWTRLPRAAVAVTAKHRFSDVEVEDWAAATVELEGGATVQILSTMAANPERKLQLEIYCRDATVLWSSGSGPFRVKVYRGRAGKRRLVLGEGPTPMGTAAGPETADRAGSPPPTGRAGRPGTAAGPFSRRAPGIHPLQRSLASFRDLARRGLAHRCSAVESLPALLAVELAYRSAADGTRAETEESTADAIRLITKEWRERTTYEEQT